MGPPAPTTKIPILQYDTNSLDHYFSSAQGWRNFSRSRIQILCNFRRNSFAWPQECSRAT